MMRMASVFASSQKFAIASRKLRIECGTIRITIIGTMLSTQHSKAISDQSISQADSSVKSFSALDCFQLPSVSEILIGPLKNIGIKLVASARSHVGLQNGRLTQTGLHEISVLLSCNLHLKVY